MEGARLHAGVAFADLAHRSGIGTNRLANLLDAKVDFTVVDLAAIAEVLEVTVTALLPASAADDG
ncbi:helix-turn-helix domain-containing protein [Microbacterium sp. KSW4-16]|uniref:helix-turn-helix domain-containing protein n=1 Tax=Microbacterium aurugineum TaxID=2851642 RepID=UPI0020BFA63E|nr:helix-turn-helix transcriptional regulator [Microbacterium aurugineum]MCK8468213.1 helix-turn-helix domain-containing protein [Microbacterium aurugineum]